MGDWLASVRRSWPYAVSATMKLYLAALLVASLLVWLAGFRTPSAFAIASLDPATASMVMILAAVAVPSLYAPARPCWTHVWLLPLLFLTVIFVLRGVVGLSMWGIVRLEGGAQRTDVIWTRPEALAAAFAAQALWLALSVLRRPPAEAPEDQERLS